MTARLPAYATIPDWCDLSGFGRAKTYDLLSKGHLKAKKVGRRVLIDVAHGMRYVRSQPDADVRLKRAPREVGAARPASSAITAKAQATWRSRTRRPLT